ncbi:MAG: phage tail protein [Emcibacter sp.]|nr:phage tail protein [Emcibacter sp.]
MAFNFAPLQWALCDGQILPINQNQALYSLLGVAFGGDGKITFALPDMRGRTPIGVGRSDEIKYYRGESEGNSRQPLSVAEMPSHRHGVRASSAPANEAFPGGHLLANKSKFYAKEQGTIAIASQTIASTGGSVAHNNMQPYLGVNYCIAIVGMFPSRN